MKKWFLALSLFLYVAGQLQAQTRDELERQRQQLRKEIEQTTKMLNSNQAETKENLLQWRLINNKVNLQQSVINNLNKDLSVLNNNMYTMQKDINKYDKLLDTLKQEYAKSMVYAYKNRSNYDFLNFIFAADNFNDAIKRVAYLKSYRNYREMQGQNILRTQDLRKKKISDLSSAKVNKGVTIKTQSKEVVVLEEQQNEKDRIVQGLKKQGKELNGQIFGKQKQLKKVDNNIASAIKKALADARKEALAKAAVEEKKRKDAERAVAKKLADDAAEAKRLENARIAAAKAAAPANTIAANPIVKPDVPDNTPAPVPVKAAPVVVAVKEKVVAVKRESELLNASNVALNASFERNKGSLPWPVDNGYVLMHYGNNKMPSGSDIVVTCTTISSPVGTAVKSVFDGVVILSQAVDEVTSMVVIQHGKYFTTYSNMTSVAVQKDQEVRTGQVLGKVAENIGGSGAVDFYISNEKSNYNPETWLRNK